LLAGNAAVTGVTPPAEQTPIAFNGVPRAVSHAREFAAWANCRGRLELARRKEVTSVLASYTG